MVSIAGRESACAALDIVVAVLNMWTMNISVVTAIQQGVYGTYVYHISVRKRSTRHNKALTSV